MAWTGKQFVAACAGGLILASDEGSDWQAVTGPFDASFIFSRVIWTGSRLVLAGTRNGSGYIATADRDVLAVRPRPTPPQRLAWTREGEWLAIRASADRRAFRARLLDPRGIMRREAGFVGETGGMRMSLRGLGKGRYLLVLDGGAGTFAAAIDR